MADEQATGNGSGNGLLRRWVALMLPSLDWSRDTVVLPLLGEDEPEC